MSEEKRHSFWTTLPGILTGGASLLTALVAILTFFSGPKQDSTPAPNGTSAGIKLQNIGNCKEFAGKWDWFIGGELRADRKGYVDWRKNPEDAQPVVAGRWTCVDSKPKAVNISWQNGISETLAFSPDKKSLSGTNTLGVRVSGTKKG